MPMQIVVTTCDAYAHIIPIFARAFYRAWPECDWPVRVIWASNRKAFPGTFPHPLPLNWDVKRYDDDGWAYVMQRYVLVRDDPFLLMLDDYIVDSVDRNLLSLAVDHMQHFPDVGMIRLHPTPGPTLPWVGNPDLGVIDKREPYPLSLQPAIWRPQVFRDLLDSREDAWDTETRGSMRAREYVRYTFLGTTRSAISYRGLMRRGGLVDAEAQAWIAANIPEPV